MSKPINLVQRTVFAHEVVKAFQYLIDDFGFQISANDGQSIVAYSSDSVVVRIYLEYSYALELFVALRSQERCHRVRLQSIVKEHGGSLEDTIQASNPERVRKYVHLYADLLREYGSDILLGDANAYGKLLEAERSQAQTPLDLIRSSAIRRQIDEAWQRQDYRKAATLIRSLPNRSPVDDKRLAYALKKL